MTGLRKVAAVSRNISIDSLSSESRIVAALCIGVFNYISIIYF
ncbi:unannotated protein [freshwater metagenome]|uniref:Unannotated protein n=1 Tax=freshwater metagenome TaxID=449393 RepID=A0A6J7DZ15_9ZZZZ